MTHLARFSLRRSMERQQPSKRRLGLSKAACGMLALCSVCLPLISRAQVRAQDSKTPGDWATGLEQEVKTLGKPAWRPMLAYEVELHRASTHPATPPFEFPWEDVGRGYGYGPATGSWDLAHEILDVLPTAPQHAREQLINDVRLQLPSGFLPGVYWMRDQEAANDPLIGGNVAEKFSPEKGNPPLWIVAADDYLEQTERATGKYDRALAEEFLEHLTRQIGWFERERRAQPDGFLYLDIVSRKWESGVDEGVRFDGMGDGKKPSSTACIDATSHVYLMYVYAEKWSRRLGHDATSFAAKAAHLRTFIQTRLWSERDGFFYDSWMIDRAPDGPRAGWHGTQAAGRDHAVDGMWPLAVGAATPAQAKRVLEEWLMRPDRFFTPHPLATVAASDPKFSNRMWRGPVWNAMTYWAARGAVRYGYREDARRMVAAALDDSAAQYDRTGKLWEYYSATSGKPEDLIRKPGTKRNMPFSDYLGLNPMIAMARIWQAAGSPAHEPAR